MFSPDSIAYLKQAVAERMVECGPLDVQLLPTSRCNASCVFCPLHAVDEAATAEHAPRWGASPSDLHGGLLDRLYDDLYRLGGLRRVHFTGGEPLLFRHLAPMLFEMKRSFPEAELTVVSNGILLPKRGAALVMLGLDRLSVSLNAGSPESFILQNPGALPKTFEQILSGIRAINKLKLATPSEKPYVSVTAVLTRHIVSEVEELYKRCVDAGAGGLTFIPLMQLKLGDDAHNRELLPTPEQFKDFMRQIQRLQDDATTRGFYLGYAGEPSLKGALGHDDLYSRIPCYAGYAFAMIWPNGDVRPCCNCEEVMGNLGQQAFTEIWHSQRYKEYRDRMLAIPELGPPAGCACDECGYIYENKMIHELIYKDE